MDQGEPESMAAAVASGGSKVKVEEEGAYDAETDDDDDDGRSNKRAKTTGDVATADELIAIIKSLAKCDLEKIVVAGAEEKGDYAAIIRLNTMAEEVLDNFRRDLQDETDYWEGRMREADRKKIEQQQKEGIKRCIECAEPVSEGGYYRCAKSGHYQRHQRRSEVCTKCYEEKEEEGSLRICSRCNYLLCSDCYGEEQCGYTRGKRCGGKGCGRCYCRRCSGLLERFSGRFRRCDVCDMFVCYSCADDSVPYVEHCKTCGKGGFQVCENGECSEKAEAWHCQC